MKTILIPTDFSANALNALKFAVPIAKKLSAELLLFHSYFFPATNPAMPVDYMIEGFANLEKHAKENMDQLIEIIKKSDPEIKCSFIIQEGNFIDNILVLEKERKPEMIIMGTQGAGSVEAFLLGTNTASVIENAKSPIVAIPENASFKGFEHIIFASDFHDTDVTHINQLIKFFAAFNSHIHIVHVESVRDSINNAILGDFKKRVSRNFYSDKLHFHLIQSESVMKGLEKFYNDGGGDLLVMATHKRNFLEKITNRSLTKKMAYHAKLPLLVFHELVAV
jgi:nucleotide-binding universal stress UspA family protein